MRVNGILMPIFSLPSDYGIGTFGKEAFRFVDFLKKSGQTYWQILPIGPTGFGDSPYQSFSSFAGNPYFIDLELLQKDGLLTEKELKAVVWMEKPSEVAYDLLYQRRYSILKKAFSRFREVPAYTAFCKANAGWLDDYAMYTAIKNANGGQPWYEWDKPLRQRQSAALDRVTAALREEIRFQKVLQFWFYSQWQELKSYANKQGIRFIGDLPIYVSLDSADVWAAPEQFALDEDGHPTEVAGCPPDAFSDSGQLWGNPVYRWDAMKADGFAWWCRRINHYRHVVDTIRIDHFRGFESYYCIPAGDTNAKNGIWRKGPGMALFNTMKEAFGELSIIAEDLGYLTPEVHQLLKDSGFPGMKVLEFAFDPHGDSVYLPHHHTENCVIYTGTHDNDTIMGWFQRMPSDVTEFARRYLRLTAQEGENWGMMKAAMASPARICILQMQDFMGLDNEARINTPSTLGGNWQWRIDGGCINDWLAHIIYEFTDLYRRLPQPEPTEKNAKKSTKSPK